MGVLACITGDQGDASYTASFLEQSVKWASGQYKERVVPGFVARILSGRIHQSLRSHPIAVQGIVAGRGEDNAMHLFGVDRYGALHEDNFIVTEYGLYFLFGVYDMMYKKEMGVDEVVMMIKGCLRVLKEKMVLSIQGWRVDVIGPDGHEEIKL